MIRNMHRHFLEMALHNSRLSSDPATRVGAVIVDRDQAVRAMGFNGFPDGIAETPQRMANRDYKLMLTVHAEMAALMSAVRQGISLFGCTLYIAATDDSGMVWGGPPCCRCAVHIIDAGIRRVVSFPGKPADVAWKWREDTERARALLEEAYIPFHEVPLPEPEAPR
jgi:dCMP deaminase